MLLTSMNYQEINNQVMKEYRRLWDTTVERLLQEYDRERKKLKIDKSRIYARDYHVKTSGKNTWIICIGKAPAWQKYTGAQSTSVICAVHYYAERGTRVLVPSDSGKISVFNSHFFTRYNERLNLSLHRQVDVIAHFFKHNREIVDFVTPGDNRVAVTGYCRNGILLGELCEEKNWLVWRTFVSRDLARTDQEYAEGMLICQLSGEIIQDLKNPWVKPKELSASIGKLLGVMSVSQQD